MTRTGTHDRVLDETQRWKRIGLRLDLTAILVTDEASNALLADMASVGTDAVLLFGDRERARCPWATRPCVLAHDVPFSTVTVCDGEQGPVVVDSWLWVPSELDPQMPDGCTSEVAAVNGWDYFSSRPLPWNGGTIRPRPGVALSPDVVYKWTLMRLVAAGKLVVANPDVHRSVRRRAERLGVPLMEVRPVRQGDTLPAFHGAEFRPRSCFRSDGQPKATLDAPTAKARAASIGADAYHCDVHGGWHVGNRWRS